MEIVLGGDDYVTGGIHVEAYGHRVDTGLEAENKTDLWFSPLRMRGGIYFIQLSEKM